MSSVEWTQFVEKGLVTLTAHQRHAIELIHFEGYTLLEASGIMEEGLSNIKNHYFRGMKILREFFNAADRTTSASRKMEENSISAEPSLRLRLQSSSGRCV
jgi:DNA-directed RNA polymerase specialized sigma24 family protein